MVSVQGWYTVIVALVNSSSVISAVQFALGHPASAAVGWSGAPVVAENATFPFLISPLGMKSTPVRVTSDVHEPLVVPEPNRAGGRARSGAESLATGRLGASGLPVAWTNRSGRSGPSWRRRRAT